MTYLSKFAEGRSLLMPHSVLRFPGAMSTPTLSRVFCSVLGALPYLVLLMACQTANPPPASQVSVLGLCGLPPDQYAEMDQSQVREWFDRNYGITPSADTKDGLAALSGTTPNKGGATAFFLHERVVELGRSINDGPTFGQVVAALGSPTTVYGTGQAREVIFFTVGLDFPNLGLSIFMSKRTNTQEVTHEGHLEVQLKEEYRVSAVECYAPQRTMDDMLRERFAFYPATIAYEQSRRKPWTGFGTWVPLVP